MLLSRNLLFNSIYVLKSIFHYNGKWSSIEIMPYWDKICVSRFCSELILPPIVLGKWEPPKSASHSLAPEKIFDDHALQIVGKRLVLGKSAIESSKGQARRNEFDIGSCERRELKWGSGGLPLGKFFDTMPFKSLENAPVVKISLFKWWPNDDI